MHCLQLQKYNRFWFLPGFRWNDFVDFFEMHSMLDLGKEAQNYSYIQYSLYTHELIYQ